MSKQAKLTFKIELGSFVNRQPETFTLQLLPCESFYGDEKSVVNRGASAIQFIQII
jgi:hypothetical protein